MPCVAMKLARLTILLALVVGALSDATSDFNALVDTYWRWRLDENPDFAVIAGKLEYVSKVEEITVAGRDRRYNKAVDFLKELEAIPMNNLNGKDRLSYRVLKKTLEVYTRGYQWKDFTFNYVNFLEGPQLGYSYLTPLLPFHNETDFENYITRLSVFSRQILQHIDMLKQAVAVNKTNHIVSMHRVPDQIASHVELPANETEYYEPFLETLTNLTNIPEARKNELRDKALGIIRNEVQVSFQNLADYIQNVYMKATRPGLGVSTLPGGAEYYQEALKWHLSVDLTPEEVHETGKREVERIKIEMNKVKSKVGFNGTLKEFVIYLKNQSRFFLNTEEELLQRYRDIIFKRVKPELPKVFDNIPNLPLIVRKMKFDGPGGQYMDGTADGSVPGVFEANTRNPTARPTFDMLALCLHEADPGHHMQISYMLTAGLPEFRSHSDYSGYYKAPFNYPFYTAYTEGWALYAESLGEEMGLYKDDYELFGRYVSEIFRACRLVIDTGLHVMGWGRQQAIDYMAEVVTDPIEQIAVEIDRYVTWPGQACAYKIGEIRIMEMRKKAEKELGDKFEIKDFHTEVLAHGSMPLDLLGDVIDEYITKTKDVVSSAVNDKSVINSCIFLALLSMFLVNMSSYIACFS